MIKIAVLDDYQNIFEQIVNTNNYKDKFEFTVFNEHFENEEATIVALEDFSSIFIMRERTPITKNIMNNLPKLKYIMTSGTRNKSIDLATAKNKKIVELKIVFQLKPLIVLEKTVII